MTVTPPLVVGSAVAAIVGSAVGATVGSAVGVGTTAVGATRVAVGASVGAEVGTTVAGCVGAGGTGVAGTTATASGDGACASVVSTAVSNVLGGRRPDHATFGFG